MKSRLFTMIPPFLPVAAAVVLFFILVPLFNNSPVFFQRVLGQVSLPIYGWTVCADLGIGPVSGVPGDVQRVEMCNGGWQVQAFCIDPGRPVPAIETVCSMVNSTDFWCGDEVQQLREYQIVSTPQADTPAPSATATSTASPTATSTATFTVTFTATATTSPTVTTTTALPTGTPTPTASGTPVPSNTPSPAPSTTLLPTTFNRPYPGGPGNQGLLLSLLTSAAGVGILALAAVLHARNTRRMG